MCTNLKGSIINGIEIGKTYKSGEKRIEVEVIFVTERSVLYKNDLGDEYKIHISLFKEWIRPNDPKTGEIWKSKIRGTKYEVLYPGAKYVFLRGQDEVREFLTPMRRFHELYELCTT